MIALLTEAIQGNRFPLSPHVQRWKRIRVKPKGEAPAPQQRTRRPSRCRSE